MVCAVKGPHQLLEHGVWLQLYEAFVPYCSGLTVASTRRALMMVKRGALSAQVQCHARKCGASAGRLQGWARSAGLQTNLTYVHACVESVFPVNWDAHPSKQEYIIHDVDDKQLQAANAYLPANTENPLVRWVAALGASLINLVALTANLK